MKYRILGRTGIKVSEIALGCEGFVNKSIDEVKLFVDKAYENGINFIDFYSSNPNARESFGKAIEGRREQWIIEGHLCTIWKNNQYLRTRKIDEVKEGFIDLLKRLQTNYIDVGMIHYIDAESDFNNVFNGEIIEYALELKKQGIIKPMSLS